MKAPLLKVLPVEMRAGGTLYISIRSMGDEVLFTVLCYSICFIRFEIRVISPLVGTNHNN